MVEVILPMHPHLVQYLKKDIEVDPYRFNLSDWLGRYLFAFTRHKVQRKEINSFSCDKSEYQGSLRIVADLDKFRSGQFEFSKEQIYCINLFLSDRFKKDVFQHLLSCQKVCQKADVYFNQWECLVEYLHELEVYDLVNAESLKREFLRYRKRKGLKVRKKSQSI